MIKWTISSSWSATVWGENMVTLGKIKWGLHSERPTGRMICSSMWKREGQEDLLTRKDAF